MDHDRLKDLRKLIDVAEAQSLTGAEARAVDPDVMERDLLKVRAAEILLKALFPGCPPRFRG